MKRLGPYELNNIITGDAKELSKAIPDNSVDLIFTDPVYDRIEDYEWLAETAVRVLKDDRACLVWTAAKYLNQCGNALKSNLDVYWTLFGIIPKGFPSACYSTMFHNYRACIYARKGKPKPAYFSDVIYLSSGKSFGHHKWAKNIDPFMSWIPAFVNLGQVVFDPFTGSGTVPAVCKMLGRDYLAFEIDAETADLARERVRMTQPPLLVPEPIQMELA